MKAMREYKCLVVHPLVTKVKKCYICGPCCGWVRTTYKREGDDREQGSSKIKGIRSVIDMHRDM